MNYLLGNSLYPVSIYDCVSEGLGTIEFTNLIG